jgi:hypothetical protein
MREDVEAAHTFILRAVAFELLLEVHHHLQVQKCGCLVSVASGGQQRNGLD